MKYAVILLLFLIIMVLLFAREVMEERKKKVAFEKQLFELLGKLPPEQKSDRLPDGYFKTIQERSMVDEITWEELDMDAVYKRLDYTVSRTGAEYLYAMLHCPSLHSLETEKWEEVLDYFSVHQSERVKIQMLLAEIGRDRRMSFYECLEDIKHMKSKNPLGEYAVNLLYLIALLTIGYDVGMGLCILAGTVLYQIVTYFKERAEILPYLRCVAELLRMAECMKRLENVLAPELQKALEFTLHIDVKNCAKKLSTLKKHSFWVMQCGRINSSPVSMIVDYVRMLFHTDIIQFIYLKRKLIGCETDIKDAAVYTGFLDSSISIALYRASLPDYCIPELYAENTEFFIQEAYHPLLKHPVANSLSVSRKNGILITGSNASGKSTFLKTIAVNLVLAQTIHTALAKRLRTPFCFVYTSMGARDSIEKGESSYMAEILSLKRIQDAAENSSIPVFCFVDEILRGTNTAERIASSAQILKYFRKKKIRCFAATHDRELTQILETKYDNYHFKEEVKDGDIVFPYKLLEGCADTSNAIRLLEAAGFAREITTEAEKRVKEFLKEGTWK